MISFNHNALHILEIDRLTPLRLSPQQPPRLLLLALRQDPPCPQPPLLLNLMPDDLRPLYSPPPVLPRQLDLRGLKHISKNTPFLTSPSSCPPLAKKTSSIS